ncbi:MAG: dockerin type I repeat-containing protein, partial [bacterium]|nr:dockerin type I repeat-containing protein [bacterium]
MKKRILSMLLCLCMVLALIPATAMAEGPVIGDIDGNGQVTEYDAIMLQNYLAGLETLTGEQLFVADFNGDGHVDSRDFSALQSYLGLQTPTLAVTVDGFEVGKTPADCTYSFESTIPGVTFSADDILVVGWLKFFFDGAGYGMESVSKNEVFEAGTRYRMMISLDNKGLELAPAVTVNGIAPDKCEIVRNNGVPYAINIVCELGTPVAPALAITVDGFEVGKTPADCTLSFESTIPDVTFSKEDIQFYKWEALVPTEEGADIIIPLRDNEAFKAGASYWIEMHLDNKGLGTAPAVTVNGKTPEYCTIATRNGVPIQLQIYCELGTPAEPEPVITLTVPFTTTVKQGGNVAPGETTFELAIVGSNAGDENISDVTVSGSVTTNGAGDYDGTLTFTGPERSLWYMLSEGAFVQQVNDGKANWTYDDTVWGVLWWGGAAYSNTDSVESTVIV